MIIMNLLGRSSFYTSFYLECRMLICGRAYFYTKERVDLVFLVSIPWYHTAVQNTFYYRAGLGRVLNIICSCSTTSLHELQIPFDVITNYYYDQGIFFIKWLKQLNRKRPKLGQVGTYEVHSAVLISILLYKITWRQLQARKGTYCSNQG